MRWRLRPSHPLIIPGWGQGVGRQAHFADRHIAPCSAPKVKPRLAPGLPHCLTQGRQSAKAVPLHQHAGGRADRSREVVQEVLSLRVGNLSQGVLSGNAVVLSDVAQDALTGGGIGSSEEGNVLLGSGHWSQSGGGVAPELPNCNGAYGRLWVASPTLAIGTLP